MTQQPPPPSGGPPSTPYGGPPGPYPPEPSGPGGGMSNKGKFWLGVALTLPAMFVSGVLVGIPAAALDSLNASQDIGELLSGLVGLALLAGWIMMLVLEKTRWIALGMLAGSAIVLILAAGACVVLLFAVMSSYG